MTLAELERAIKSRQRVRKIEQREKATFDYTLANIIGKSISRIYSSAATMPEISEVYPALFDSIEIQEQKQKQKDELSALRFKLFVNAHNNKLKQSEVANN